jgi:tRNA threonylcarbamoyladenosine biosynthesis protein TsaE
LQKTGFGVGQIHIGDANLGKSQRLCPSLYLYNQEVDIKVSVVNCHPPIVKSLRWPDEAATCLFASQLAQQPGLANAVLTLDGDLGAGKTTLVRYLLQALGVQGRIKSPTYAVVEPYSLAAMEIWHFDFYRFNDPQEWEDAGFRDIFASPGLKLVEWPQQAQGLLPQADLALHLRADSQSIRWGRLCAHTALGCSLLAQLDGVVQADGADSANPAHAKDTDVFNAFPYSHPSEAP